MTIPSSRLGTSGRLARAAASHPWRTITAWIVVLAAGILLAGSLGDVLTQEGDLLVETESETADELIDAARASLAGGADTGFTEFIIVESETGATVQDPAFQGLLASLAGDLGQLDDVVRVVTPADGAPVTADGTAAVVQATVDDGTGDGEPADLAVALVDVVDEADATDGFRVTAVGEGSVNHEFNELAEATLQRGELFGLPAATLVLILVFGAVVAAFIPLGLALVTIVTAIGLSALVGQLTDLSFFIVNMITMIGLAVGIDYTLFVVQRFREERVEGRGRIDAAAVAGDTAARAVFFSGLTVVIALLGLMLMPDTTMRSLGLGAILSVIAAVLAALTLLPAILGLLGDRINRLRVPFLHRDTDNAHRFWNAITRRVTKRPVVSVVLAAGLLLVAAVPYLSINVGSNFIDSLPEDSDVRHGFEVLNEEFQGGLLTTPVAVRADDVTDPDVVAAMEALVAQLDADPAYAAASIETLTSDLAVVEAAAVLDPSTDEGRAAVQRLREEQIPAAFAGVDAEALVTGDAAFMLDFVDVLTSRTPLIFAVVLSLSFLLLLLVFRSIVVPLKAIVMNLLSVGAAYGLLTAVFQWGWGADLFGFQQTDVIESWVPLFLFAVLFGLSMDYHVFLLSRIKERYDRTRDNSGSVAFGLSVTGAIITGAALIMVAVFAGFAAGDLVMFQQMGFGLAVAVILDATIVRSVLVPATMELLGDRNWYFPAWLSWLPEVHVEAHAPVDEEPLIDLAATAGGTATSRVGPGTRSGGRRP